MRIRQNTEIYICREGVTYGPLGSVEEVRQQLAEKRLDPNELAWCQGLSEWAPLSTVLSLAETPAAAAAEEPAVRQSPEISERFAERITGKDSVFRKMRGQYRLKSFSGLSKVFSVLNRNVAKDHVSSEQLGDVLWVFCKTSAREFHAFFKQILERLDIRMDENQEFAASQEILLMNMWLISRELPKDHRAIVSLHQNYVARQAKVAAMLSRGEEDRYRQEIRQTLQKRCAVYEKYWNPQRRNDQMLVSKYILAFILNAGQPDRRIGDKSLQAQVNVYIKAYVRAIHEVRERFDVRD